VPVRSHNHQNLSFFHHKDEDDRYDDYKVRVMFERRFPLLNPIKLTNVCDTLLPLPKFLIAKVVTCVWDIHNRSANTIYIYADHHIIRKCRSCERKNEKWNQFFHRKFSRVEDDLRFRGVCFTFLRMYSFAR